MPRSRTIKPQFFLSEIIGSLPMEDRLFLIGLWGQVDREGRCEERQKELKLKILPYDDVNVEAILSHLCASGKILRYEVSGVKYLQVDDFKKHQHFHKDEKNSELPGPSTDVAPLGHHLSRPVICNLLSVTPAAPAPKKDTKAFIDALCRQYQEVTHQKYAFHGSRDGKAVREMLAAAVDPEDACQRFAQGLTAGAYAAKAKTIYELWERWNKFDAPKASRLFQEISFQELCRKAERTTFTAPGKRWYVDVSGNLLSPYDGSVPDVS